MTRYRVPPYRGSMFDAKEDCGMEHGWPASHADRVRNEGGRLVRVPDEELLAEQIAEEKTIMLGDKREGDGWMCGDLGPPCACGYFAALLCDYPMGGGKTCDLPLCESCAFEVGEDRHLCLLHHAEFRGKARVEKINPWPPPRKR